MRFLTLFFLFFGVLALPSFASAAGFEIGVSVAYGSTILPGTGSWGVLGLRNPSQSDPPATNEVGHDNYLPFYMYLLQGDDGVWRGSFTTAQCSNSPVNSNVEPWPFFGPVIHSVVWSGTCFTVDGVAIYNASGVVSVTSNDSSSIYRYSSPALGSHFSAMLSGPSLVANATYVLGSEGLSGVLYPPSSGDTDLNKAVGSISIVTLPDGLVFGGSGGDPTTQPGGSSTQPSTPDLSPWNDIKDQLNTKLGFTNGWSDAHDNLEFGTIPFSFPGGGSYNLILDFNAQGGAGGYLHYGFIPDSAYGLSKLTRAVSEIMISIGFLTQVIQVIRQY